MRGGRGGLPLLPPLPAGVSKNIHSPPAPPPPPPPPMLLLLLAPRRPALARQAGAAGAVPLGRACRPGACGQGGKGGEGG